MNLFLFGLIHWGLEEWHFLRYMLENHHIALTFTLILLILSFFTLLHFFSAILTILEKIIDQLRFQILLLQLLRLSVSHFILLIRIRIFNFLSLCLAFDDLMMRLTWLCSARVTQWVNMGFQKARFIEWVMVPNSTERLCLFYILEVEHWTSLLAYINRWISFENRISAIVLSEISCELLLCAFRREMS